MASCNVLRSAQFYFYRKTSASLRCISFFTTAAENIKYNLFLCFHLSKAFVGASGAGINLTAAIVLQTERAKGRKGGGFRDKTRGAVNKTSEN